MDDLNISICSVNCRGLNDYAKRKDVLNFLRAKNYHIYFLQDSHFLKEKEPFIRSEWGSDVLFNSNNGQSRGVAIMFSNNIDYKIHDSFRDDMGNLLILSITMCEKKISLVNVYGPNADDPEFFVKVMDRIKAFGNCHCIIAGFFYLCLQQSLDTFNYQHINNPNARKQVIEMIGDLDLVDVWRDHNPDVQSYTWRRPNPIRQARLDFFLVSQNLCSLVCQSSINVGYRTDHLLIDIKFNNSFLRDYKYVVSVKETISNVVRQYAPSLDHDSDIGKVNLSEIDLSINDQLFLETLLMEIRGKSISYFSFLKKSKSKNVQDLLDDIKRLETNLLDCKELEEKRTELEEICKAKMEGIIICSRAKWINEGEKVSRYFRNLENRNFVNKGMSLLELEDGSILESTNDIVLDAKSFYERLYSSREHACLERL